MPRPPKFDILPSRFHKDPYPYLAQMRETAPICFVPQLDAVLFTKRDDIFECEKNIEVFSSSQPGGLMTVLMGENMMRKDGKDHHTERSQMFPALSPKTVQHNWKTHFVEKTQEILDNLKSLHTADLTHDYAMPVSAAALKVITGLTNISEQDMDRCSQHMIDGCANYAGDKEIESRCHTATKFLDEAIEEQAAKLKAKPDMSVLSVLLSSNQPMQSIKANIKLAISGGQNEPRDAIAGTAAALLSNPGQLDKIIGDDPSANWFNAFEEYARWMSPIGMSPRLVAQDHVQNDIEFKKGDRVFFMFGSANRDEEIFSEPDAFDIGRDTSKSIPFGAGPHFCAGAAASKCLIAEVALPMLFDALPKLQLQSEVEFAGWAFRGPLSVPTLW